MVMNDERLIQLVQENEMLYNLAHKNYSDVTRKEQIWNQIGGELNRSASECKARWTSLRDQFRRAIRDGKTSISQSATKKRKWKFEDEMSFLIPYFRDKETTTNNPQIPDEVVKRESAECPVSTYPEERKQKTCDDTSTKKSKRKTMKHLSEISPINPTMCIMNEKKLEREFPNQKNADDSFFESIAETVKSFNPYYKNLAKSRIFEIVSKLEMEQIESNNTSQYAKPFNSDATMTQTSSQHIVDDNSSSSLI